MKNPVKVAKYPSAFMMMYRSNHESNCSNSNDKRLTLYLHFAVNVNDGFYLSSCPVIQVLARSRSQF